MPLKIIVFREDRRREGCAFVMGVNEMTRVYGETVRCFESKERLPKSVCYVLCYGRSKKNSENVGYFNYLGSLITNGAKCTREIKQRIAMAKGTFQQEEDFSAENWF